MDTTTSISGPDFLERVADVELGNGNEINAATFRDRARQWRLDQVDLREAQGRVTDLEAALADIQRTAKAA